MTPAGAVLVTGGSGYIARYCIVQLLAAGWKVRATLRHLDKASEVRSVLASFGTDGGASLEFAAADLNADDGWNEAAQGCNYILHIASPFPSTSAKDDDELIRLARESTLRVLRVAAKNGVRRVLMTSSGAAIAYGRGSRATPFTEDDWSIPSPSDTSAYERSKLEVERAA